MHYKKVTFSKIVTDFEIPEIVIFVQFLVVGHTFVRIKY